MLKILSKSLKINKWLGSEISLQYGDLKFTKKSKSQKLNNPIGKKEEILKFALKILNKIWPLDKSRFLGLTISSTIKEENVKK